MKSTEPQPLGDIDLKLKDILSRHPSVRSQPGRDEWGATSISQ